MADLFISYKSDRRPAARYLSKCMKLYGFDAWYDYGLIPGEDFEARLLAELEAAKVCLVLWCSLSVKSEWVRKEVTVAVDRDILLRLGLRHVIFPQPMPASILLIYRAGMVLQEAIVSTDCWRRSLAGLDAIPSPILRELKELDEDWRTLGAPSLAMFALGSPPPPMQEAGRIEAARPTLSERDLVGSEWRIYYSSVRGYRDFWLLAGGQAEWRPNGFLSSRDRANWRLQDGKLCISASSEGRVFANYRLEVEGDKVLGEMDYGEPWHKCEAVHGTRTR